jgi:uncharacterized protein YcbX
MRRMTAVVTGLHHYPVKSCRGLAVDAARVEETGLPYDRRWLVVTPGGRFVTQREHPRLAQVLTAVHDGALTLTLPGLAPLRVTRPAAAQRLDVVVWDDRCAGFDCGDEIADALSALLGFAVRLVEFDDATPRLKRSQWLGERVASVRFPDAFPLLLIGEESLDDLNARLPSALPMDRFRPNIVVRGLGAYGEDRVRELRLGALRLQPVKPCTRCTITMTDQATAAVDAAEPLRTLKTYRWDRELRGVTFGQNVIVVGGAGSVLRVGDRLDVDWRG